MLLQVFADKAGAKARFNALDYDTDWAGNKTGESLKEIFKPVSGEINRFLDWAHAAKALQLAKYDVNAGIDLTDAKYIYEQDNSPKYREVLKKWSEWNQRGIDLLVDAGAMTKKVGDFIKKKHPVYIPLHRAFEKGEIHSISGTGKGPAEAGKPIKKIKGSGRPIIDPVTASLQQREKIISVGQKIQVMRALAKLSDKKGVAGLIWQVPTPKKATTFTSEQIKRDIIQIARDRLGLDLDDGIPGGVLEQWDDLLTVFSNATEYRGKDNIVVIDWAGKKIFYEVSPDLFSVLKGLDQYRLPWYIDLVFGKLARTGRLGATGLNPAFGL